MELRHLRYFLAVSEHRSFRRAAQALGVQQSAISRRVRDLEDEIGVTLFIRHHGGVDLTFAGRKFRARASKAISLITYAAKDAAATGRGEIGVVRIGIFSSLASGFLADLLYAYNAAHPEVRLDLIEGSPNEHLAAVQHHQADVAFLTGHPASIGCNSMHLWNERVFVTLPRDHDLVEKEEINWLDLRGMSFVVSEAEPGPEIHDYLVKHLAGLGHRPSVERCAVYRDNLMQLVALGRGLSLTSEATTAASFPGVVYRPLVTDELPFSAIWSLRNDNPALRRLISLAKTLASKRQRQVRPRDSATACISFFGLPPALAEPLQLLCLASMSI